MGATEAEVAAAVASARQASPGALLRQSGPRILRDGLGPTLVFYAGWRLAGLLVGVGLATVFSLTAFAYERRHGRPGLIARMVLAFVILQAAVGLAAHSATLYLAQPVLLAGVQGLAWLGSVAIRRPLAGLFAGEVFSFSDEVRASETFRQVFTRVSAVWGFYFLGSCALQLTVLAVAGVGAYVITHAAGSVGVLLLIAWSIRYTLASFRASDEWGWALAAEIAT